MSEMETQYNPQAIEAPIFQSWVEGGYFRQDIVEGKDPYVVVIPPPNVTGVLHMGHALNDTIQDAIVRRQRMKGRPTRWVLGTDHAGIATQNKVEQKLAKEGKTRYDLGREAFIEECWKWRTEHGNTIVEQIKRIGCSIDYEDEWFTMNESYQRAVRETFVDWWDAGYIYRGNRIINWCPRCKTALADDEVEHEDVMGHLWHVAYPLVEPKNGITHAIIATTRPETMLGDVAIAVNPNDERYKDLVGSMVTLPLVGRQIPIIADDYVDVDFGTGMVKITPAHDPNDFEVGERHNLEKINVMSDDAHINELGGKYAGLDRFDAREQIVADLEKQGFLTKVEEHEHAVGHCYRCHTVVEPWLSDQWFVDMQRLVGPAIEVVKNGEVEFHPQRFAKTYLSWMENIRNWCISRQLWWGHRIPVFYCDACGEMVASKTDLTTCPKCGAPVRQDEDVLDTWFSSQLWPFAVFGWPEKSEKLSYFYPTSVLSTARDIINLWVARMIVSGMYFMDGQVPFKDVIIHPTVLDKLGRRMSKSLGNGVDPIELIEEYGADAMRFGLLVQVTGSQDMKFDREKLGIYRNFANKIWNASRFVLMNCEDYTPTTPQPTTVADRWILSRLARLTHDVDQNFDKYEFGEMTRVLYDFFWNEFCNWYIELSKGRFDGTKEDRESAQSVLMYVLDQSLRLLHPIMPFITEEIWRNLPVDVGQKAESLMIAQWPEEQTLAAFIDDDAERSIECVKATISAARSIRARYGISPKESLDMIVSAEDASLIKILEVESEFIAKLANLGTFRVGEGIEKPAQSVAAVAAGLTMYVPLEGFVDFDAERVKLSKQCDKLNKDLEKFDKKLSNPGFLAKAAPEVIESDRAKAEKLRGEVDALRQQIAELDA